MPMSVSHVQTSDIKQFKTTSGCELNWESFHEHFMFISDLQDIVFKMLHYSYGFHDFTIELKCLQCDLCLSDL